MRPDGGVGAAVLPVQPVQPGQRGQPVAPGRPDRRRVLAGALGVGGLAALSACRRAAGRAAPPPPNPSPAARPSSAALSPGSAPASRGPATEADWTALRRSLAGTLSRPSDPGYDRVRLLFNRRFDGLRPAAVASCARPADVATAVAFARRHGLPVSVRAGGHSYLGASAGPGLVVDVRPMSTVAVDAPAGTATVGAGAALVDVYSRLADAGVSIPAGSCPAVGVTGLALGGGMGVVARRYGLTCDRLVAAEVVTADGRLLRCDATTHPDLFWALRGGGGNFGVVTSLTLRTHPTRSLGIFTDGWPWTAAGAVLSAWQSFAPTAPDALWSTCHLLAGDDNGGPPSVSVSGVYLGPAADLDGLLAPLRQRVGVPTSSRFGGDRGYLETMLIEAGCAQHSVAGCRVADTTPGGELPRDAFVAASDFFTRPLPPAGVRALVSAVQRRQADPLLGVGGVGLDSCGGAVNRVPATATAFVHRDALFAAQYTGSWGNDTGAHGDPQPRNQAWLDALHRGVRPYASGQAYQNYADPTLADPQTAYYGRNLARLSRVRAAYDPDGVFSQPQGVPLPR